MANVITNFLVGLGFDYDQDGERRIEDGIDRLTRRALQLGAVVTGAFGIRALTSDFAASTDTIGKFSEVIGVSADDISAFGRTLGLEGGSVDEFAGSLRSIVALRDGLLAGDAGFIGEAARFGVDVDSFINAQNPIESYLALADQFQRISPERRRGAAAVFGLGEADIRLLSRGRDRINELVEAQRQLRPITADMTVEAARFNDAMQNLGNSAGGVADEISIGILPALTNFIEEVNEFVGESGLRADVRDFFETTQQTTGISADGIDLRQLTIATGVVGGIDDGQDFIRLSPLAEGILQSINDGVSDLLNNENIPSAQTINNIINRGAVFEPTATDMRFMFPDIPSFSEISSLATGGRAPSPQMQRLPPIQIDVSLDGQIIDQRIINTNERLNRQALEDLSSSIGG